MSRDYTELERELIDDLKPRTGKDLAEWMAAIDAAQLPDRNAIIDWLRPQGFSFSNASWIERIHHNGGRPIYLDREPPRRAERRKPRSEDAPSAPAATPAPAVSVQPPPPPPPPRAPQPVPVPVPAGNDPDGLEALLAAGKAYRPLAQMLIAEIRRALPGVTVAARAGLITFLNPNELAALSVTAKELRLGLCLGDRPVTAPLARAKLPGAAPAISQMIVLSDARQVDGSLTTLILAADAQANRPSGTGDHH
jgi:hypothetical protein